MTTLVRTMMYLVLLVLLGVGIRLMYYGLETGCRCFTSLCLATGSLAAGGDCAFHWRDRHGYPVPGSRRARA